jgi:deoxycytidylate deaminase
MAATTVALPFEDSFSEESLADDAPLKEIKEIIGNTHSEELIITLCGYIGTDIHGVGARIKYNLETFFDYNVEILKLSDFIKKYSKLAKDLSPGLTGYEIIRKLIDGGNQLREAHGNSILAELAIQKINFDRINDQAIKSDKAFKTRRNCYIIDSIKNIEELDLFKMVYNDIHYSIGVFSPIDVREEYLRHSSSPMKEEEISSLVDRDSGEEIEHGQQVRDTFIKSDYFLRLDSFVNDALDTKLNRFLNLIFGSKVITPTREETAMYHASSASNNSACLSRQVGAAITDKNGEILAVGWNDVPKANGGLYQSDILNDPTSAKDKRCFNFGNAGCRNDAEKNFMAHELVNTLIKEGIVEESKRDELYKKVRNSKIKSLVEFSRAIHAEMHAIIVASQTAGERVRGGNIFITTYPCHNCARHIIASGIKKVYYIEPYRKSLTIKLHSDAITENENDPEKVLILMYDGVSPFRYMDLFRMKPNSRKTEAGLLKAFNLKKVKPKATLSLEAIPVLESKIADQLGKKGLKIA